MYPDLSYLFADLLGTDPDNFLSIFKTFGLLLALALIAAGSILKIELKRREQEGLIQPLKQIRELSAGTDWSGIVSNALVLLVLGMKIPYISSNFTEFQADPASVLFSSKGNLMLGLLLGVAGFGLLYYFDTKREKKSGKVEEILYPHKKATDITILAGISGVIGAKLFSVLENLDAFFRDPIGTFFSGSGLTVYGGLILATIVVYRYIKKLGIPPAQMFDIAGMAILVGYGVGRLGCHFSGDGDWGIVASQKPSWWFLPDWVWAYGYPNNVNNEGELMAMCDPAKYQEYLQVRGMSIEDRCQQACGIRYCHEMTAKVYPTPIWETTVSMLMFGILWVLRRRVKVAGSLFCGYLILQGIERFWIETLRVNDRYEYFGVNWSQAQYISVAFVVVGAVALYWLNKKGKPASA